MIGERERNQFLLLGLGVISGARYLQIISDFVLHYSLRDQNQIICTVLRELLSPPYHICFCIHSLVSLLDSLYSFSSSSTEVVFPFSSEFSQSSL